MTTWVDTYRQMLTDCENREEKLTDWERKFVDSVSKQMDDGRPPSQKQIEIIDRIWDKVT